MSAPEAPSAPGATTAQPTSALQATRAPQAQFPAFSRLLHWLMAIMVLTMLFVGVGMVSSETTRYQTLVSIHKPLGIAIFLLVIIRFINRLLNPPPPLPATIPTWQRLAAEGSHYVLYALMFIMPLVGWGMLSAEPYPIVLFGSVHLPPILPENAALYAWLRQAHTCLAYLFFATFLAHFGAALLHGLIRRDGVFESMASVRSLRSSRRN
jgi:cytochrome b561